ncbi:MAG: hypothetical protein IT383_22995 [Deltaproteobacteria bacterium]|nr:hypothetical protein [Deltaproteobacteria bacterium]
MAKIWPVVTAKISELKDRLSHYLRLVQRGERVLVCDRDRVIACIEPAGGPVDDDDDARIAARLPASWLKERPKSKASVVAAVLADRREGR